MRYWALACVLGVVGVAAGCAEVDGVFGNQEGGFGGAAGAGGGGGTGAIGEGGVPGPSTSDKVDLLLVIDNSRSMADKQEVLSQSVAPLIDGLVDTGVHDMHVGVISTSLGGLGADVCSGDNDPMENDGGRLIARDGAGGVAETYNDHGFLVWDPDHALSPPGEDDPQDLEDATATLVVGAGDVGCGFESQLESFYRFLIDPDPYEQVVIRGSDAVPIGTDEVLLQQRAEFLRRDSLVIIVVLSDENDCSTRAGGEFFYSRLVYQPGTNNPYHLPPPRAACAADPSDPCCRSCGQEPGEGCDDSHDDCFGALDGLDDHINLRCFDQKSRFGIDFLWPIDRYDSGLSTAKVVDRAGDVVDNPLYTGERGSELVILGVIVGAPWQLTSRNGNPHEGAYIASEIDAAGWSELIGNPASYAPPGDPHMLESIGPRPRLPGPTAAPDADPIHGHDYSTPEKDDLQYACIFPLPMERDCTSEQDCDCGDPVNDQPICEGTTQIAAKSYPGIRELDLVRALEHRGVVGSICPAQLEEDNLHNFGYRPTFDTLLELAKDRLE